MKTKLSILAVILLFCIYPTFAQKLSVGIESGINFSNINKSLDNDRFTGQPGPVTGIFVKQNLGNWFVVQSGINHATLHFSETSNTRYYPDQYRTQQDYLSSSSSSVYCLFSSSSYCYAPPSYNQYSNHSKFSFLRVPLLLKFKTPGKVNVEFGGGAYYAFLTNDEYRGKDKDFYTEEYRDENFPPMNDWGWILASSVNYNINNKWSIFASGKITYGKEEYFENVEGKMGSTELTFGLGYKPFAKQKEFIRNDSLGQRISILPHTGINISRVKSDKNQNEYSSSIGFSSGISLKFLLGENVSFISGAWYERKGYNLDYAGYYPAIYYIAPGNEPNSVIKSEVQLDYLTIPLMMDISMGKKIQSHINFGVYYSHLQNAFVLGEETHTNEYEQGYQIQKEYFNKSQDLLFKNHDYGFMLAYRIDVPVFKWACMFASVNQSFGITNILDDGEDTESQYSFIDKEGLKNSSTSVHFGLSIPVNKNK